MIVAKVTCTKKRPAPGVDYSSDCFSATLEVELPEAMYINGNGDLGENLTRLFKEVKAQVDSQIENGRADRASQKLQEGKPDADEARGSSRPSRRAPARRQGPPRGSNGRGSNGSNSYEPPPASSKQVNYLIMLAKRNRRMRPADITQMVKNSTGKAKVYDLNVAEASRLIEELKQSA